jgi:hypothetical protein
MKPIYVLVAASGLLAASAIAQTIAGDSNPSLKDPAAQTVTAPARGANSFTEDQARGRITDAGYTGVTALAKNESGQWTGTAMRGGKTVGVALDYKGNVSVR